MCNYHFLRLLPVLILSSLVGKATYAQNQNFQYHNSQSAKGLSIAIQDEEAIEIDYSIHEFSLESVDVRGEIMNTIVLPGAFLFNNAGAPDLPGNGKYILIEGDEIPDIEILSYKTDTIKSVEIAPAPIIPTDIDRKSGEYFMDSALYQKDSYYPASAVKISKVKKLRGLNVVMLGITPFRYNPVKNELVVFYDLRIRLSYNGKKEAINNKYVSHWWYPLIKDIIVNNDKIKVADRQYNSPGNRNEPGAEYLIFSPDGNDFLQWADTIKKFRTEQGILTKVVSIAEIGGNTSSQIESYIDNAYNNWTIPPDAVLLLGDHGTNSQSSITSNILNNHPGGYNPYISDNPYADVNGDDLPDVFIARITARDAVELELMINKFVDYERNPPTNPSFYNNPVTALGWQTTRWFQICSETIGGFWKNQLGKDPVRINEVYSGNPDTDPWSTATNSSVVLDYFGTDGLGYIPENPSELGSWTGGTATDINNAINSGAFMLQHRDHGNWDGWGEPAYTSSNISGLNNTDLTFIMSINCQTGKFNNGTNSFTENFHRYNSGGTAMGALGLIAATEISYSFVNDTYVWGFYDYLWPEFMPENSTFPESRDLIPCFANAAGKYFLEQSGWPYNTDSKQITYNLFHHHGDAFMTLYSEVPQILTVSHDNSILFGLNTFIVNADSGAFIALTSNQEILATTISSGNPDLLAIPPSLIPGDQMIVTITQRNKRRYKSIVSVEAPNGPFVISDSVSVVDFNWNNNASPDYGESNLLDIHLWNAGNSFSGQLDLILRCSDPYISITDSIGSSVTMGGGDTVLICNEFSYDVSESVPDNRKMHFNLLISNSTESWTSYFNLSSHAPLLKTTHQIIIDTLGNGNCILDPGETATLQLILHNSGSSEAYNTVSYLSSDNPGITITTSTISCGNIEGDSSVILNYLIEAASQLEDGITVDFLHSYSGDRSLSGSDLISFIVGKTPVLVIDLDENTNSAQQILLAAGENNVTADYTQAFPQDLSAYSSVFVCLGVYSDNHTLTNAEGQQLASYLDQGGNLYMEGGDTWYYDDATAVHPYFNISGLSDGASDLDSIQGISGSFTEGLKFSYSGDNAWIDNLGCISTAFPLMENNNPMYSCGIANETPTYNTIGVSFEFGGLDAGSDTPTKLIGLFLRFFDIPVSSSWLGNTNDWNDPDNWSNNLIPDDQTHVIIPAIPLRGGFPSANSGDDANCRSLKLDPGATLNIPFGKSLTVYH